MLARGYLHMLFCVIAGHSRKASGEKFHENCLAYDTDQSCKRGSSFYLVILLLEIYIKGRARERQRYRFMDKDVFSYGITYRYKYLK